MKLLAIETSTDVCSVGLSVDGQRLLDHRVAAQKHGMLVLPMVDALMQQAGLQPAQLDGVVFGRGPGSFTGVRIGVAVTQGIALGADVGVMGVSTLQTVAQGVHRRHGDTHVLVSIDARMSEVYTAACLLDEDGLMQAVTDECLAAPEAVIGLAELARLTGTAERDWRLAGSGAERYLQGVADAYGVSLRADSVPHAQDLLDLGEARLTMHPGDLLPPEQAMPVYLRDKVAFTTAEREQLRSS